MSDRLPTLKGRTRLVIDTDTTHTYCPLIV